MTLKRKKIVVDFEASTLLDLRKLLFKRKLTLQQYFTYVVDQTITYDDRMLDLVDEAREYKTNKTLSSKELDAEALYALIADKESVM